MEIDQEIKTENEPEHEPEPDKNNNNNNNNNNNIVSPAPDNNEHDIKQHSSDEEADDNDFDDDEYLQELHWRLNQMKQERKNAEKEASLLDNRLNWLKNEEEKNWIKIENKKKKANEKWIYLQSVIETMKQNTEHRQAKEREILKQREANKKMRDTIKASTEYKRAEKQRQLQEEARWLKLQKQYNEQLLQYLNKEKENANKTKCESIKSQYLIDKERKMNLERERKIKLRAELEKNYERSTVSDELEKMNLSSVMKGEMNCNVYTETMNQKNKIQGGKRSSTDNVRK